MKNIRLGYKLITSFMIVALIVLALGIFSWRGSVQMGANIGEIGLIRLPSIQALLQAEIAQERMFLIQRTLMSELLDAEGRADQYSRFHQYQMELHQHWEAFKELPATAEEERLSGRYEQVINEWESLNNQWLALSEELDSRDLLDPSALVASLQEARGDYYQIVRNILEYMAFGIYFEGGELVEETALGQWAMQFDTANENFLQRVRTLVAQQGPFHAAVREIKELVAEGRVKEAENVYRSRIIPLRRALFEQLDGMVVYAEETNALRARINQLVMGDLHAKAEEAASILEEIAWLNERIAGTVVIKSVEASEDMIHVAVGGMIFGVVLAIALGIFMTRLITGPIFKTVAFAKSVASGRLNEELAVRQKDEIGDLAEALRTMVINLKAKILEAETKAKEAAEQMGKAEAASEAAESARQEAEQSHENILQAAATVERVVERMTTASEQLSAQVEQSSRGAEEQKNRIGETATAMEEMNATVLEVAKNASDAAEGSDKARAKAQEGGEIVTQAVAAINQVHSQAREMADNLGKLGKQAEQIGRIMNVIDDIADQTNLLALNAAIEAARAGDAGRGFAVVADEVRKLAEKTMNATKEVGDAIFAIQEGTRNNIQSMEQAVQAVGSATRLANTSGDALQEIVSMVEVAADQVRSIATAAEEQSAASEEINRSVDDINRISSETSEVMVQSAQAVSDLAEQAVELRSLVQRLQQG